MNAPPPCFDQSVSKKRSREQINNKIIPNKPKVNIQGTTESQLKYLNEMPEKTKDILEEAVKEKQLPQQREKPVTGSNEESKNHKEKKELKRKEKQAKETPEQTKTRLEKRALKRKEKLGKETAEETKIRKDKLVMQREKKTLKWKEMMTKETPEERKMRREKKTLKWKEMLAKETPEEAKIRREKKALKDKHKYVNETPEITKIRGQKRVLKNKQKLLKETPEETKMRRENKTLKWKEMLAKETPEEAKIRREQRALKDQKMALKNKLNLLKETPEASKIRKEKMTKEAVDYLIENVPNISQYVETKESIKLAYTHLMKTQLGEDEKSIASNNNTFIQFPLLGMCHQANVCVCCDRFITGTSDIKWINKAVLLSNKDRLQDSELSNSLNSCYNVLDVELHDLLLSPRARVNVKDDYICCCQCFNSLRPHMREKPPPKFTISNKWSIGNIPSELLELITEVTSPLISPVRPFAYVMSFTGGAHKSITGSYTFFGNNIEEDVGALGHHVGLTGSPSVYIVMSGRFTPSQRTIVRKRCLIEVDNFAKIYNWLRENNPLYKEMPEMSRCPTPIMFEDEPDVNNTDESEDPIVESHVDFHYWFPSNGEKNQHWCSVPIITRMIGNYV